MTHIINSKQILTFLSNYLLEVRNISYVVSSVSTHIHVSLYIIELQISSLHFKSLCFLISSHVDEIFNISTFFFKINISFNLTHNVDIDKIYMVFYYHEWYNTPLISEKKKVLYVCVLIGQ